MTATRPWGVYRPVLPEVCPTRPDRMVYVGDAGGRCEVFTWDRATGRARQVTKSRHGTLLCAVDADCVVWWFAEEQDGTGVWCTQDFDGGPRTPAFPGVPPGHFAGLAFAEDGTVALGLRRPDGTTVHLGRRGERPRALPGHEGAVRLCDVAPGAGLLALTRSARAPEAVTVVSADGRPVAALAGGERPLWARGFAPGGGAPCLLLIQQYESHYRLATWTADRGLCPHPWSARETEFTARWFPDGERVLIRQERHGRTLVGVADLVRGTLTPLATPPGSLLDAAPAPDGDIHFVFTDAVTPARPMTLSGAPLPGGDATRLSSFGTSEELWTDGGPVGPVHTFLSRPTGSHGAQPLVLLVHGGPADHDRDVYDPMVQSLVGSGLAVARVNYRGSTGYGARWRSAWSEGVGHTQVADLVRVRADLVRRGVARPDAVGLCGTSWGGYLTLLAAGTHPGLWAAAVAVKPLADCATAYHHSTPALQALDRALFGGTPEQVPERYAHASPLTHATAIRAPLLLVAARHDTKCPPRQVEVFLAALETAGVPHDVGWLDSGHDGYDGAEHAAVTERSVRFLLRRLTRPAAPSTDVRTPHGVRSAPSAPATTPRR
ncbi:alpha/beta hydrolase family protein [Streptomyces syringium]|uniref:S9 family peptidase n=1 Tax=Streptomyces syringium TaxID=76729 RepID=UPI0036EDC90D